jgi:myo-inositol-1(or 4)-monophosphatase
MLNTAIDIARKAGEVLRREFGKPVKVNENSAHDIKIQADIDTQNLIYSLILEKFPDHRLIGEEGDSGNPTGDIEWIVDPIDGTLNFAHGIPHFCISIAVRRKGEILIGVIYDPIRDELFSVERGTPTMLNGQRQRVSDRSQLKDAILAVGFSKDQDSIDHALKLYQYYGNAAKKLRVLGSAALDLAYVASGRFDAYIEKSISLWDIAAGELMVRQSGGKFEAETLETGKFKVLACSGKIEFTMR